MIITKIVSLILSLIFFSLPGGSVLDLPSLEGPSPLQLRASQGEIIADLDAQSVVVYDPQAHVYLINKNGDELRSIASITKLMTALVFLDTNPQWSDIYTISDFDRREGGRIYLYRGEQLTIKELFYTSLVASANSATMALVNSTGLSEEEFVQLMNAKARELFLFQTSFRDPIGLSSDNVSTAKELALLVEAALDREEISEAVNQDSYTFYTQQGQKKVVESTDALLNQDLGDVLLLGGKTGYTNLAGYCFASKFSANNQELISVVLGSSSAFGRFGVTKTIMNWIYANYQR